MKKRMMQVADFAFDVCATEENVINDFVQAFFDKVAGTGTLKFCYKVASDGYNYQIDSLIFFSPPRALQKKSLS